MNAQDSPEAVYRRCVEQYHSVLEDVTGDTTISEIPEIMQFGKQAILSLVDDVELDAQYMFDQFQYRFVLICKSIQFGIVYASFYTKEPQKFEENIKSNNIKDILPTLATVIQRTDMGVSIASANQVASWIFDKWRQIVKPGWTLECDKDCIVATYTAAFQFGVSWFEQAYRKKWGN